MADSALFTQVAESLERETSLDRLESRGTLRLALKASGLEPKAVSATQMQVVLRKVLPAELAARGIADGGAVCERLALGVAAGDFGGPEPARSESPDAIFARLAG